MFVGPLARRTIIAERPMVRRSLSLGQLAALCFALSFSVACGSAVRHASVAAPPAPAPEPLPVEPVQPPPPEDPVVTLIALSEQHFRAGQRELELGHVEGARLEFDKAVNVLLESAYGGRTEPRIREHFDRLVDRISAYEVKALAEGDGFTEKKYEPASIDELLAMSATLAPPQASPEVEEAVQNDPVVHDIPIPFNPRVMAYVQLFQGRLREFIQEGLDRGSKYLPMIQNVFRAEGLPLDLAYIPLVESAFKPNALSRAKAKGVWQFMRGTGVENGLRQDWYIDERSDPEKATVAAAKYLNTLVKMFDGDWHLALASYNGGPGRVQRALQRARTDDFWTLAAKPRILPRETRDYVPMILAAIVIARNPALYGFEFEVEPPVTYDTVTLPKPVDLRRVAEWTDTTIDQIQTLNPELRRWTTPVRDEAYELKVPQGTAPLVTAQLEEAATLELASLRWHTVKKGESLATVARKLGVNRTDLAEANYLKTTARIAAGQRLMVPHESTVLLATRTDRPAPVADSKPLAAVDAVVPAVESGPTDRVKVLYQVKRGDTLASIARVFRTTVSSLQMWNSIDGTRILAGDRITIYTSRSN
jgi:membrane-bound lytic murein transglycosylase D